MLSVNLLGELRVISVQNYTRKEELRFIILKAMVPNEGMHIGTPSQLPYINYSLQIRMLRDPLLHSYNVLPPLLPVHSIHPSRYQPILPRYYLPL